MYISITYRPAYKYLSYTTVCISHINNPYTSYTPTLAYIYLNAYTYMYISSYTAYPFKGILLYITTLSDVGI